MTSLQRLATRKCSHSSTYPLTREERREQTGVSSVNLLPKEAEAQDSEVSPCLDYNDNTSRGSLVTSCLRIKSSK